VGLIADYNWAPLFGVGDVHAQNVSIKPMVNAWYYVEVKKCMLNVTDSVYIIVNSIDKPEIEQHGNTLVTTAAASYEWFRDGIKINEASGKEIRIDRQGFHLVSITTNQVAEVFPMLNFLFLIQVRKRKRV
jgi:hypothetical protein